MRTKINASSQTSILALSLAAIVVSGCQNERLRADADTPDVPGAAPGATELEQKVSVEQVQDAPADYYGKQVRVTGEIDDIYGDRAFKLEGTGWAFDDDIIVLTKTPVLLAAGPLVGDDELIVTGTVKRFTTAEIEREVGWDLKPELEVTLRERPVLIADSIYNVDTHERWTGEGVTLAPVASVVTIVTTIDPQALVGQKIDLGRERVQSVMGKGLWIGPSNMAQVFVLPESMPEGIKAGDTVQVSGTLRQVPRDATKQWGLPRNMAGVVREETLFIDDATVQEPQARPET